MRYNDRATLIHLSDSEYNPESSSYEEVERVIGTYPCNINPLSFERLQVDFGDVERHVNVVRLQRRVLETVNYVEVNQTRYKVLRATSLLKETAYYVENV